MNKEDVQKIIEIVNAQIQRILYGYSKTQRTMVAFETECMQRYTGDGQTLNHITLRDFLRRLKLFTDRYTEETIEIIHKLNNLDLTNIFDTYADLNIYYQSALAQYQQELADYHAALDENPDSDLQLPTTTIHTDYLYVVLHDESTDNLMNYYRFDGEQLLNITQDVKPHTHFCLYYPDSEQKFVEGDDEGNIFFYDEDGNISGDYNYTKAGKWTFNILEEDNFHDGIRYLEPAARDADIEKIFEEKIFEGVILGDDEMPEDEVVPDPDSEEPGFDFLPEVDNENGCGWLNGEIWCTYFSDEQHNTYPEKMYQGDVFLSCSSGLRYRFLGVTQEPQGGMVESSYLRTMWWLLADEPSASQEPSGSQIVEIELGEMTLVRDGEYKDCYSCDRTLYDTWRVEYVNQLGSRYTIVRNSTDGELYAPYRVIYDNEQTLYFLRLYTSYEVEQAANANYKMYLDVVLQFLGRRGTAATYGTTRCPDGINSGETCYDILTRSTYTYRGYNEVLDKHLWNLTSDL